MLQSYNRSHGRGLHVVVSNGTNHGSQIGGFHLLTQCLKFLPGFCERERRMFLVVYALVRRLLTYETAAHRACRQTFLAPGAITVSTRNWMFGVLHLVVTEKGVRHREFGDIAIALPHYLTLVVVVIRNVVGLAERLTQKMRRRRAWMLCTHSRCGRAGCSMKGIRQGAEDILVHIQVDWLTHLVGSCVARKKKRALSRGSKSGVTTLGLRRLPSATFRVDCIRETAWLFF